jgi:hypothetical protein
MWRRVDFVRTDVSVEHVASIFRAGRISRIGAMLTVIGKLNRLLRNTIIMRMVGIGADTERWVWKGCLRYVVDS